ncbi:hypothetical protein WICPIJ_005246 [Wickerhamomyces pijperi]|uniref:Pyruvate decarboxylase n=1 Tax=Wickerhamomyces pijperi TaxID=599730 RepID=A0A9P8Q486_WICPI|nr:hypothetical protein WICPIJ_005246 [Wickerhamomyces pijperi]
MTPISIEQIPGTVTTATDAAVNMMPLGEYIFKRLEQVHNVRSVFGVPGDFQLSLLEHIYKTKLNWVGGCNELNSGYAADGYSRYTRSLGVLITTYGVGELSAINAVSGAFAEYSKILHIVGMPSTKVMTDEQLKKQHIHHLVPDLDSLKDSNHLVYADMVDKVCCAKKIIMNQDQILDDLDDLILQIFKTSRPGYLFLPVDLSDELVNAERLHSQSLEHIHKSFLEIKDSEEDRHITELANKVLEQVYNAKNPVILADVLADRYANGQELLQEFINKTNLHHYVTFMGKSLVSEYHPKFVGDYQGSLLSNPGIHENFVSSDLVLYVGPYINEMNTGKYTAEFKENTIILHADYLKIGQTIYRDAHFIKLLAKMNSIMDQTRVPINPLLQFPITKKFANIPSTAKINQSTLLSKLEAFIQPNDVLVCETGSVMFGLPDIKFPTGMRYIAQGFYLSIGMALPASVGVGCAMRDLGSSQRLILLEGDGSAQMTIQEISAFEHLKIKPIIFLLNNNGYTVERIIKGEHQSYNDVKPWNWLNCFKFFNVQEDSVRTAKIVEVTELTKALNSIETRSVTEGTLEFYEIILDQLDVPWRFHAMNSNRLLPKMD